MEHSNSVPICSIREVGEHEGQKIRIQGWLFNKRSSGKIEFLQIRDGTGVIQCVALQTELTKEQFAQCQELSQECSVVIDGIVRKDPRSKQGFEITVTDILQVSTAHDYPITPKEHGIDFLLEHRHLWIRAPRQRAILKIRAEILRAMSDFLDNHGFTRVDPPILTPSSCEGTSELFHTKYFEEDAFLTQSGQMYMEAAAMSLGRVYSMGPTFRAEKSKTRRHLIEFWMIEPEMAYVEHEENLKIQEKFVAHIVQHILENCNEELTTIGRNIGKLQKVRAPFPRVTYDAAIEWLQANGHEIVWGEDFGAPHETAIAEQYDKPVFIERYPTQIKAFYMQPDPHRPETVLCADLLAPEGYGEIIGGSQRIDDYNLLKQRFEEHQLPTDSYQWYLDLRKFGSVPHSGFGIGLERTVAWICGLEHVREAGAFPRMLNRLYP